MVRIVFASLAPAALAEFVRLPMEIKMKEKRRAEGTSRLTKHFATYRRTLYALRQQSDIESESAFNATAETEYPVNVPLQSYHELAYTGPFSVGDGSKFVTIQNMVYDTGSELCWSFSANEGVQCCRNAVCDPVGKKLINCNPDSKWQNAMRLFGGQDPSCQSSETLLKLPLGQKTDPFVVCYGRGFARGTFTNSTVRFHPAQKAIQHPFGIATTASDLEQDFGGCSGLLGLGPKNSERNPSIIYRMYSQGVIDEPMFSFSLGGNRGPEFILGGVDTSLVGPHNEMRWFPIKRQRLYSLWWTVDATFHTNEHSYSTPLVLDSGTTAVMIAKSHFDKFVRNVAADFGFRHNDPFLIGHADGHIDFKHCEDPLIKSKRMYGGHALKIRIGDSEYTLHPKDYIVELKDHSKGCFFGVSYLSDQDDVAILGDVFMKKYYTAFHFNKADGRPAIGISTPAYRSRRSMPAKKVQKTGMAHKVEVAREVATEVENEMGQVAGKIEEFGADIIDMGRASFAGEWKRRSQQFAKQMSSSGNGKNLIRKNTKPQESRLSKFARSIIPTASKQN